ncbi:MAG: sugar transferase [Paludibacteraceae bacterium]|nr:sugar transferase [Paludibacteraceae bacterium]
MYIRFFKRLFDILGALAILPFVLIEIIILAPFIYFTDRGPVFYNATRAGKDYKPFKMFKLRSMYVNSPDIRNVDGSTFNSDEDPRVTPIGHFMRKTSLDEFPQFLNVLRGDMSFIGPRPKLYCPKKYPNGLPPEKMKSFMVKPGVTGYAQAYYRNSISQDEKFYWDGYYAENVSFKLDVWVAFKTILSVLTRKNINMQ